MSISQYSSTLGVRRKTRLVTTARQAASAGVCGAEEPGTLTTLTDDRYASRATVNPAQSVSFVDCHTRVVSHALPTRGEAPNYPTVL